MIMPKKMVIDFHGKKGMVARRCSFHQEKSQSA